VRAVRQRRREAGSENGTRPGERLEEGKVGMALGTLCDGGVEIGDGLPGDPELGDEGLHQQRSGADALQRPLRSRFRARLTAGVLLLGV
jgi:hypothetical protein